jgi:hypothetical protein
MNIVPDKEKKFKDYIIKEISKIGEETGDMEKTILVINPEDKREVIKIVMKGSDVLEMASTTDAQESGLLESIAKKYKIKKEDIQYTQILMASAKAYIDADDEDLTKPENAKLLQKTIAKSRKYPVRPKEIAEEQDRIRALLGKYKSLSKAEPKRLTEMRSQYRSEKVSPNVKMKEKESQIKQEFYPKKESLESKVKSRYGLKKAVGGDVGNALDNKAMILELISRYKNSKQSGQNLQKADDKFDVQSFMNSLHDFQVDEIQHKLLEHLVKRKLSNKQPPSWHTGQQKLSVSKFPSIISKGESNPKTVKKAKELGIMTAILHLAPSVMAGCGDTCPAASEGCRNSCLNTSGRGGMISSETNMSSAVAARIRKTKMLAKDPELFMHLINNDIHRLKNSAKKEGYNKLAVRLNGTADLPWEDFRPSIFGGKNIFEMHPDVQFYDYTKRHNRVRNNKHDNYTLAFSRSEDNHDLADKLLSEGHNVASVFGGNIPKNYKGYNVVDGDEHDLRFLDPKGGAQGNIIGLKAKGDAKKDNSGFVIRDHEGAIEAKTSVGPSKYQKMLSGVKKSLQKTKNKINYSFNKPKSDTSEAPTLDYSKMKTKTPAVPTWKKKLDAMPAEERMQMKARVSENRAKAIKAGVKDDTDETKKSMLNISNQKKKYDLVLPKLVKSAVSMFDRAKAIPVSEDRSKCDIANSILWKIKDMKDISNMSWFISDISEDNKSIEDSKEIIDNIYKKAQKEILDLIKEFKKAPLKKSSKLFQESSVESPVEYVSTKDDIDFEIKHTLLSLNEVRDVKWFVEELCNENKDLDGLKDVLEHMYKTKQKIISDLLKKRKTAPNSNKLAKSLKSSMLKKQMPNMPGTSDMPINPGSLAMSKDLKKDKKPRMTIEEMRANLKKKPSITFGGDKFGDAVNQQTKPSLSSVKDKKETDKPKTEGKVLKFPNLKKCLRKSMAAGYPMGNAGATGVAALAKPQELKKKQGVPKGVSPAKHERCVQDVKKKGHGKVSAIKICNTSLQKSDIIKGGVADNKSSKGFDKNQLKQGIKVESEHSNNKQIQSEIAKDHLTEDKKYYTKLKAMEGGYSLKQLIGDSMKMKKNYKPFMD